MQSGWINADSFDVRSRADEKKSVLIRLICVSVCYIETKKMWVHSRSSPGRPNHGYLNDLKIRPGPAAPSGWSLRWCTKIFKAVSKSQQKILL